MLELLEGKLQVIQQLILFPYVVDSTEMSVKLFRKIWDMERFHRQEQFYALFLDDSCRLICWKCLNTGTLVSCQLDVEFLMDIASQYCSRNIVLSHNHPKGTLIASDEDIYLTEQVIAATAYTNIQIVDHIILTSSGHLSLINK